MHTFRGTGCRIHYNSDASGDAIIAVKDKAEVAVPAEDLLAFVADIVRTRRIRDLEGMEWRDILGLCQK